MSGEDTRAVGREKWRQIRSYFIVYMHEILKKKTFEKLEKFTHRKVYFSF